MNLNANSTLMVFLAFCHGSRGLTTIYRPRAILEIPVSATKSNALFSDSACSANNHLTTLFGSSNDDNAPKRKRKRKKKAQVVDVEDIAMAEMDVNEPKPIDTQSMPPALNLKPREDTPVKLEVENILAASTEPEPSAIATISSMLSTMMESTDTSRDSETMASAPSTTNVGSSGNDFGGQPLDDSLDQLLEDVRLMTQEEKDAKNSAGVFSDEEGAGVKEMIGNTLSTIVTADFFVVCAFLVWFLLGIFCSYVLKDDTVQIAFNNNFETLVQPALGVLMIAAIGGSFFKEEEQEYDL